MTIQDLSELGLDAKMAMEAAKKAPGGPYIKAGAALGSVAMRRLGGKYIDNIIDTAMNSNFFKDREPMTVYALGKKRFNLKRLGYFPDTKDAVSQFGQEAVDEFMEKGRLHRLSRSNLGKKELMKDFNETLDIIRDDGTEEIAMIVKRKKNW